MIGSGAIDEFENSYQDTVNQYKIKKELNIDDVTLNKKLKGAVEKEITECFEKMKSLIE